MESSPRMLDIGVRSPIATNTIVKTGSDSSTAKRSSTGVNVMGPKNAKESLLHNDRECSLLRKKFNGKK